MYHITRGINNVGPWYKLLLVVLLANDEDRGGRVVLIMEVTSYLSVNSTMIEHRHSEIVVDDGMQTYIYKNTSYNDKQES